MNDDFRILLVSGSTRGGSTNTALLQTAAALWADQATCVLYQGLPDLPAFNPDLDHDPLPPAVTDLRARIEEANALFVCTPEYAGGLPGSFKNLLDWTVGGVEINDKAVGWMNVSSPAAPTGGADAYASLAKTLGWVNADIVQAACLRAPLVRSDVGSNALIDKPAVLSKLTSALQALKQHARASQ
jgi:chromate reductase